MRAWGILGCIAVMAVSGVARAQSPAPPTDPGPDQQEDRVDDVVVTGRSLERLAQEFTEEVSNPASGRGLARWRGPVCIGVYNFRREVGYQIADGLAHMGGELGVPIDDEACDPNIWIVGTEDGRRLASDWVDRRYREFRTNISGTTDSRGALDHFRTSDMAVRWWAISRPVYFNVFWGTAAPASGPGAAPIEVFAKSQIPGRIRDDLQRLVIILDVEKVSEVAPEDLIAYLAMVSFAQVDMQADMQAFDTILNLFGTQAEGGGLTDWDKGYIAALYAAPDDQRLNAVDQADDLARRLDRSTPTDDQD